MEETKNEEIQTEETQNESQTAALLEPTPYKRKVNKEETDDTATVSKDTASEEAATPMKNALLMLKRRCLRKDMTTLNAITILL